ELGSSRGRAGGPGAGVQPAMAVVGDPGDRRLRLCSSDRGVGHDLERLGQACRRSERGSGFGERVEPALGELGTTLGGTRNHLPTRSRCTAVRTQAPRVFSPDGSRLPRVAQPARRVSAPPEDPPVDPEAIDRPYDYHRARRNARIRRKREKARARLRFFATSAVLVGRAEYLVLTSWHGIRKVFGLSANDELARA